MAIDASIIPALAAFGGATIGGLTSVLTSRLNQRSQARAQQLSQETIRRQDLYKEFIEAAARCYADALQNEKPSIPAWIELYAKIGRMRILSSPKVVDRAEQIGRRIIDTYLEPNKAFPELRDAIDGRSIDLIRDFSQACRKEYDSLRVERS